MKKHKDKSDAKPLYSNNFTINDNEVTSISSKDDVNEVLNKSSEVSHGSSQETKITSSSDGLNTPLPEWYHPIIRKHQKQEIIKQLLNAYNQPFKIDDKEYAKPTEKDLKEYEKILEGLKLEKLSMMGNFANVPLKLDFMDRFRSLNKKEHAVVTIFNDNRTTDTGVIHCYDRTFSRKGMSYLVMSERGIYDPEFKMVHFYYYANHPCSIIFQKGKLPDNAYDARLIDATIGCKVVEALAAIDIEKWIKIILVCVILTLLIHLLDLAKGLKGTGIPIIGGG